MRKIRVLHVINGLHVGGAETSLARLLANEDRSRFDTEVFSLIGDGELGDEIRRAGVTIRFPIPNSKGASVLGTLIQHCQELRPDIVQGWMYHGNLAASIVAKICRVPRHGWNVRHSIHDLRLERKQTSAIIRISARLSKRPTWIIYNSNQAVRQHENLGFRSERSQYIPNGISAEEYAPNAALRKRTRQEWRITDRDLVFGMIGRYHPQKDHGTFVIAAGLVAKAIPNAKFVLIGRDVDDSNPALVGSIELAGIRPAVRLVGQLENAGKLAVAFDVNVLSSAFGEGFPNVIAEGMACGVPTIGTDVGDTSWILGDTGRLVPPKSPELLAGAMLDFARLSSDELQAMGNLAKQRITDNFSIEKTVAAYRNVYTNRH